MVEFGRTRLILLDERAGILAGHGRLLAARKLGLAGVPVIRLEHRSEAQKRTYLLADNRPAEQGGWDETLLAAELARLRDARFNLDLVRFAVHPRRWVVERFFAWLGRNRMNRGPQPRFIARDVEATIASATACLYAAAVMLLIRRFARAA